MTKDSVSSGNVLFACGHENSLGNQYCDACGAAKDRRKCPASNSPNREDAKFCGACGTRLQNEGAEHEPVVAATRTYPRHPAASPTRLTVGPAGEAAASESLELFGPKDLEETQPWSGRRRWRRDDRFVSEEEDTPEDDMLAEEHPRARRRIRRFFWTAATIVILCAAVVAIGLAVGETWYGETLARFVNRSPAPPVAPGATGERPTDSKSGTRSAPSTESPSVSASTATSPSSSATAETPVSAGLDQAPPANPPLPTRARAEQPSQARETGASEPAPSASASSSETSEERMADFLVEQFGSAGAAEKARSNAAWYRVNEPEHAYWRRVADTIRLRAGR